MLHLKIRKAEVALRAGRLDDAFQQVLLPTVREHYRGQQLISKLIPAFVARGQQHLAGSNAAAALADFQRAEQLGGNQPEIAQLRTAAELSVREEASRVQLQRDQLQRAKRLAAEGALTMGQAVCATFSDSNEPAAKLAADIQLAQQNLLTMLSQMREHLEVGKLELTIQQTQHLAREHSHNRHFQDFVAELLARATSYAQDKVREGKLDQVHSILQLASSLPQENLQLSELSNAIGQCQSICADAAQFDTGQLLRRLKLLRQTIGECNWLERAIKSAEALDVALDELNCGPLALLPQATLAQKQPRKKQEVLDMPRNLQRDLAHQVGAEDGKPIERANWTDAFRLHVDGSGSFLVFRRPSITLGNASHSRPVDIAFRSANKTPNIQIARIDDDYFLYADGMIEVNQRQIREKLLEDGDKVRAGERITFRFRRPCAASGTAVIELGSSTRPANCPVRHILLMDEAVLIGPTGSSHIVATGNDGLSVITFRDGQLWIYDQRDREISPRLPLGRALQPGQTVTMNSISATAVPISEVIS